jgi:hypothetical protein
MGQPDLSQELKAKLSNREWRLDNLYWIQNEDGQAVKFVRNEAQRTYWHDQWYLNAILKARQLGFSTLIAISELDACLFNSNTAAGIIDYTLPDAKKKLGKVKFAYNRLPDTLKEALPLAKENTEEVEFANGSSIQVGTSHRGGTLQILHVSEYGKISAEFPDKAREIKTGAFGTVHAGNSIHVESTAEGSGGEFYELVQRAEAIQKQGKALNKLDFKLHFFPWWKHAGYKLDDQNITIPTEMVEYFEELEGKHGIVLRPDQKAWYVAKRYQIGPDDMLKEYPSIPEEAFFASVEGAYFKREMSKARIDGRIGKVPHDPSRKVNTFWDIGVGDQNSIWFHQTDGVRQRLIDYYENSGEGLPHYLKVLKKRADDLGYQYGEHFGPHDLDNREWISDARPRTELAKEQGIDFTVVPRVENKPDAIEVARTFLGLCWIDETRCERGIQCLDNYRKEWDERLATWKPKPRHDWASHGADSLMTGAMGIEPEAIPKIKDRHRQPKDKPRSAWAA